MIKKNFIKTSLIFALLVSLFISCDDKEENGYLTIAPDEMIQIDNDGGTATVSVSTNLSDWYYEVEDGNWISVDATSSELKLQIAPNEGEERRTLLYVASPKNPMVNKTISILQGGTYLEIDSDFVELLGEGANLEFPITTSIKDLTFTVENGDWLEINKTDNGLQLKAKANNSPITRTAILHINSELFPYYDKEIVIEQISGVILEVDHSSIALSSGGEEATVNVITNVDEWDYQFSGEWLSAEKTGDALKLSVGTNHTFNNLSTILTIYSTEYPDEIWAQVKIDQYSLLILEDNFDWLGEGASDEINVTTGERNFKDWETAYGTNNAWESTIIGDKNDNPGQWAYSRLGFVKFGKSGVNGDLITPKLSAIEGTQDIAVAFSACGYLSVAAGAIDEQVFNVEVIGPGKITEILEVGSQVEPVQGANVLDHLEKSSGELTANGAKFILGNFANTSGPARELWFGEDYDPLAPEIARRVFVVSGATSETQIRFLAGPNIGVSEDGLSYRHGFDDVRIEVKQ